MASVVQNRYKESTTNTTTTRSTVHSDAHRRKGGKISLTGKTVNSIRISVMDDDGNGTFDSDSEFEMGMESRAKCHINERRHKKA
jgi:hypothetical protein